MPAGPMASTSQHLSQLRKCAKHFPYDRGSSPAGDGGLPLPPLPHITPHLFHNIPSQASHTAYANYSSLQSAFVNMFLSSTHTFYTLGYFYNEVWKKNVFSSWCFLCKHFKQALNTWLLFRSSWTWQGLWYAVCCSDHDYAVLPFTVRSATI